MYADGNGLYLQVSEGGASWIYRYMLGGRAREMGLGPLALYGLQEARAKALDARRLRHQGVDPIDARRAAQARARLDAVKATTFAQCAAAHIKAHRAGWRNAKHATQWEATLGTYAAPFIGARTKVRRVEHHAALHYSDLPEFITILRAQVGIAARALEFAILTAARTGEVIGAGGARSTWKPSYGPFLPGA
jgi:hypothetical protein